MRFQTGVRQFGRRSCPIAAVAATVCGCALTLPAASQRRVAEVSRWERAERARDVFEAEPETQRTRLEYARRMDEFRAIYHGTPTDRHAAEAVNAVAELLEEQGRAQRDRKLLQAAVGQYEFLRMQYPGSSLRVRALLAEAQIEGNDLHDAAAARERYGLLLKLYPRSALAEEARAGLLSVKGGGGSREQGVGSGVVGAVTEGATGPGAGQAEAAPVARVVAHRRGPVATVTGIRHWSTPSYTRVAIDLGGEVEYEAARVPGPDRIYFDLHGTRLAPELVGKSFRVTDDGFLKRIRVAQSTGEMTRVVLDVNDVTVYSAFLLPNPYRLIIDIHGAGKSGGAPVASADAPARPAATVPNTRAVNGGSGADVARLSDQPGKVEATSVPTSEPISAVVPRRQGAGRQEAGKQGAGKQGAAGREGSREQEAENSRQRAAAVANSAGARDAEVVGEGRPSRPSVAMDDASPSVGSGASSLPAGGASRRRKGLKPADGKVVGDPATPARSAVPTADGQTSLVRALGLKIGRIVIDAGHGGHDSGTLGVGGLEEKDVVLDVALRLGKLLGERMGAEVIYTRSDDTFVPLETRTAIANKAQADLFLSIHANSSTDASARGVETYYLNFTQQADALAVAARENAVSDQSIYQLSDLVKKIALKEKIAESREFAANVEASLYGGLERGNAGLKNRGVKKAPFVVLIGANMPSILAEISFVTNPKDARQLRDPEYRQRVAESLYKGVARYAGGLGGPRPAATLARRTSGQ